MATSQTRRTAPRATGRGHGRTARRTGDGSGLWRLLRRTSRIVVWCLVILVGGSMIAYFALALR